MSVVEPSALSPHPSRRDRNERVPLSNECSFVSFFVVLLGLDLLEGRHATLQEMQIVGALTLDPKKNQL